MESGYGVFIYCDGVEIVVIDGAAECCDAEIHILIGEDIFEIMAPVLLYECLFCEGEMTVVLECLIKRVPP